MAAAGFIAGFAIDAIIAKLAREPYERGEDVASGDDTPDTTQFEFGSETGAVAMPRALTSASDARRVLVVAATAALWAIAGIQYGDDLAHLPIIAAYVSVFIICTGTDLLAYRVPNVITYPAVVLALAVGMIAPGANRLDVAAGGIVIGGTFFAMAVATRGKGMGMGDVKLALFVGFALGLTIGIRALLVTALAGGAFAVLLMLIRIRKRQDIMPYGPFISAGALALLFWQGVAFASAN